MKFTSRVLVIVLSLMVAALFFSNATLKNEFNKIDKTDIYWNYEKILNEQFKFLKITGGNGTHIAFEQNATPSVRILQDWKRHHGGTVSAHVKNDTLFMQFDFVPPNPFEKYWLQGITPIRIFAPELLIVDGYNTNFEMFKVKQKSITVNMAGKSRFEIESMMPDLDTLNIRQTDSSEVIFEMSPDYQTLIGADPNRAAVQIRSAQQIKSKEAMTIKSLTADLWGYSLLDIGHAQVTSLQLKIADSSAIILSGGALRKIDTTTLSQ